MKIASALSLSLFLAAFCNVSGSFCFAGEVSTASTQSQPAVWDSHRFWFYSSDNTSQTYCDPIQPYLDNNPYLLRSLVAGSPITINMPGYYWGDGAEIFTLSAFSKNPDLLAKMEQALQEEGTILLIRLEHGNWGAVAGSDHMSISVGKVKADMNTVRDNYLSYDINGPELGLGKFNFFLDGQGMEGVR